MEYELTADDLRGLLRQIGADMAEADGRRRFAMDRLMSLVHEARRALSIAEIADLAKVSRPTVYKLLEA